MRVIKDVVKEKRYILLVGISYDKDTKKHQCTIEKAC